MSDHHFMSHTHRMERAGIFSLWISLGSDAQGNRLMHVTPHESVPRELAAQFPTRSFLIDGTDPVLRDLIDGMIYTDEGATAEKVQAAVDANPLQAADLRQFYADWLLSPPLTDDDVAAVEVDETALARSNQYVKGLMRGHGLHRKSEAAKTA